MISTTPISARVTRMTNMELAVEYGRAKDELAAARSRLDEIRRDPKDFDRYGGEVNELLYRATNVVEEIAAELRRRNLPAR